MTAWKRWQDYVTMCAGICLFAVPFVFGETSQTAAAYTAYVMGILLFLVGVFAAWQETAGYAEWVPAVLAVALFVSPWVIGFTAATSIAWAAWTIGVVVFLSVFSLVWATPAASRAAMT